MRHAGITGTSPACLVNRDAHTPGLSSLFLDLTWGQLAPVMCHLFIMHRNEVIGPREVLTTGSSCEEGVGHLLKVLVLFTADGAPAVRFEFVLREP